MGVGGWGTTVMSPTIQPTYLFAASLTVHLCVYASISIRLITTPHTLTLSLSLSLSLLSLTDVPVWLKSLRLHKYQHLFAELGYEEMLTMQEAYLEQKVWTLVLHFHCFDS